MWLKFFCLKQNLSLTASYVWFLKETSLGRVSKEQLHVKKEKYYKNNMLLVIVNCTIGRMLWDFGTIKLADVQCRVVVQRKWDEEINMIRQTRFFIKSINMAIVRYSKIIIKCDLWIIWKLKTSYEIVISLYILYY